MIASHIFCIPLMLVIILASGCRNRTKTYQSMEEYAMSGEGFQEGMTSIASSAVKDAKAEFGVDLDYSPDSIQKVEGILSKLHKKHKKSALPMKEINRRALRFGIYVGEVIRKKTHGYWKIVPKEQYGPMGFQIVHRNASGEEGISFPMNWCGKRILNGEEDNVWSKFLLSTEPLNEGILLGASPQPAK